MYTVELTREATRQFESLDKPAQARVARVLDLLAEDPRRPGSRRLAGQGELRRIHAGKNHVIVYQIIEQRAVVQAVRIGHRGQIYRRLP